MRPLQTEHPLVHLAWLHDGKYLVGQERFGMLTLWDGKTGAVKHRAEAPGHQPHYLATHPDGQLFATAAAHFSFEHPPAQLWSVTRGKLVRRALPEACGIHGGLAFTPNGEWLIGGGEAVLSGRRHLTARLVSWQIGHQASGLECAGHRSCVEAVVIWPDGQRAASAGLDGSVRVWNLTKGKAVASRKLGLGVPKLALSPDGRWLAAVVSQSPHLALLELVGKKLSPARELRGHDERVMDMAFATDGRLASVGRDGQLSLWNAEGALLEKLKIEPTPLECLAIAPDSRTVAVGCLNQGANGGKVKVVRLKP